MTLDDAPPPVPLRSRPGVRAYTLLCLTALMGLILALLEYDRDLLSILLLAALGALAVLLHWRTGPPLLLLGLAVLEVFHRATQPWYVREAGYEDSPFLDAVLSAAVLAYSAGHYRLLSLVYSAFPIDLRRPPPRPNARDGGSRKPFDGRQPRAADLPGPWEAPLLAITAATWAVAVSLFWLLISDLDPPAAMTPGLWRGLLLIFLVGLTAAVLAGATTYLTWLLATPEEHLLFLQDQLWRETRLEQNQIHRFVAWARLRAQRRKERS